MNKTALLGALLAFSSVAVAGRPSKRPSDEDLGEQLYQRHCVSCHGVSGKGDGPSVSDLVFEVPDLTGRVLADDKTVALVQSGRGVMPAYSNSLDKHDTRRLLRHMERVSQPAEESE